MDISQTNDNELQKAIDDITNNAATDGANDAVSELEAKIQNQLGVPPVPPMPEIPGLGEAAEGGAVAATAPEVAATGVTTDAAATPGAVDDAMQAAMAAVDAAEVASAAAAGTVPTPEVTAVPEAPVASEAINEAPAVAEMPVAAPATEAAAPVVETAAPAVEAVAPATPEVNGDLQGVKVAMMHDLFPLMDKVNVQPEQKYEIYKEMLDTTSDKSMIGAAYEAAKGIADETARAEALLYLIETVDK